MLKMSTLQLISCDEQNAIKSHATNCSRRIELAPQNRFNDV